MTAAAPMPISNPADMLVGRVTPSNWRVTRRLTSEPDDTGGNFSVPYVCERLDASGRPTGETAFLKALDYSRAQMMNMPVVDGLRILSEAFIWERDLVSACARARMKNVVVGLEAGAIDSGVPAPLLQSVDYIIFERAKGTVRREVDEVHAFHIAWLLRIMHQTANGVRQLHQAGISHQDLKPSNVLTFGPNRAKVADLGRASQLGKPGQFDHMAVPGDPSYAPLELLYGQVSPSDLIRRRSADLYQLGGLLAFLFARVSTTAGVLAELDPAFLPRLPGNDYPSVLPMVRDAFNRFSNSLAVTVPEPIREDLMAVFRELCDPDPTQRGQRSLGPGPARYSVERYVTHFDRLARMAETRLRHLLT